MTTNFKFSARSLAMFEGVHPDLCEVAVLALTLSQFDFAIIEGVRSLADERKAVASGHSQTLKSRHLRETNASHMSEAIDICAIDENGKRTWVWSYYAKIAEAFKTASEKLGVPITWGGDWQTLKDGGHFELKR